MQVQGSDYIGVCLEVPRKQFEGTGKPRLKGGHKDGVRSTAAGAARTGSWRGLL